MILKAEEAEVTIGTMEATVRDGHLKFEKRKYLIAGNASMAN